MDLLKYRWKNRLLLIETNNTKGDKVKTMKDIYQDNIKEFHKRFIKLIVIKNSKEEFKMKLIGFDGEIKKIYKMPNFKKIFEEIEKMPLAKLVNNEKLDKTITPKNLSLYSDYNPKITVIGLGFKDKDKAKFTLEKIKDKPKKYQLNVVNTMLGRAKHHPHKTKDMDNAIKVYERWIKAYKNSHLKKKSKK